jgi:hypothetical protein
VSAPITGERPPRRTVPVRPWILVGAGVAIVLIVVVLALIITSPSTRRSGGGIEVDSVAETGPGGLRLTGLTAESRHDPDPPLVGDTVTVRYQLTNVTAEPLRLGFTFVGVRDPSDNNRDTEDANEGIVLEPGKTVEAQGRRQVDAAGGWEMWPCYELADGTQCPPKWKVIFVAVR